MTTNGWLAVIAIASVLQLAIILAVLMSALRFYRRADGVLEEVRGEVREVVERVKHADDAVRDVMRKAGSAAGLVATMTRRRVWPLVGLAKAISAGAASLSHPPDRRRERKSDAPAAPYDRTGEPREQAANSKGR